MPDPVFVLAPPRSCSTVTVALLSGHPRLYGFPELNLFTGPTVADHLGGPAPEISGVVRVLAELHHGEQSEKAITMAKAWLADHCHWRSRSLLGYLFDLVDPMIPVEKSPTTVATDRFLRACAESFPTARYLHLTRHPVTTMSSMRAHWAPTFPKGELELATKCTSAWYNAHERIMDLLSRLPPDRWFRVQAEDLINRPAQHLDGILRWLGLDRDPGTIGRMRDTAAWRFANPAPTLGSSGGDVKFFQDPDLRRVSEPRGISFDASWRLGTGSTRRISDLANEMGYQ